MLSLEATVQRAGSVHVAEGLSPPQPIEHFMASARTRTTAEGWGMGARYVVRRHATTQTVLNKEI